MAILHGSWIQSGDSTEGKQIREYLLIWGETWRRFVPDETANFGKVLAHPLAMNSPELTEFIQSLNEQNRLSWELPDWANPTPAKGKKQKKTDKKAGIEPWQKVAIALPTDLSSTQGPIPLHSGTQPSEEDFALYPWQVEGLCLSPTDAIDFLSALPLGTLDLADNFIGSDLRFWSHIARWSLDLQARCKFLPQIQRPLTGGAIAHWQPLLDSDTDRKRLNRFTKQMPVACRTYQLGNPEELAVQFPPEPQELLQGFLSHALDIRIRKASGQDSIPNLVSPVKEWLQGLVSEPGMISGEPDAIAKIESAIASWTAPVAPHLAGQQPFRAAFELVPPEYGDNRWTLQYFLQSVDDAYCLVDAKTIWNNPVEQFVYQGRTIEQPQETLLRGLGLASRLFPPLEASLDTQCPQSCAIAPLQAYHFIKSVTWRFEDSGLGVILPDSLSPRDGWATRLGLSVRADSPTRPQGGLGLQNLLNFKWELTIGGQTISKKEFDRLIALNSPLVEINGEWVELRDQDIRAATDFFKSRKNQMSLTLEDALRLATGDTQVMEKLPVVKFEAGGHLEELLNTITNKRSLEDLEVSANFKGELRPYQLRGVSWLAFLQKWGLGACLADDMGLGKSIETIAFLLYLQDQQELNNPVLLVCPTSVLGNWEREIKKFGPKLKVMVHHGDKRAKGKAFAKALQGKNLAITSYPLVYRDEKELRSIPWDGIILDEAQNIKNPQAKQSKAVRDLIDEETQPFRIALTGTPVENRLQELWSIMDFLNPGYLGARQFFQRRFATPIEKYGDTDSLEALRSLVRPFVLRRLKSDKTIIQDLPEKQENPVFCGLSAEQAKLYQATVDSTLAGIDAAEGIQRHGLILALLVKLKQICNHPAQFLKEKTLKQPSRSGKLVRLEEMLEEMLAEGDRGLIFTQFAEWGKLLQPYLSQKLGREVLFLYGGTRKNQREEMVDRFQQDPQGPPIMILSIKAGGVGLNLTRANHVFHYDRWWNPAVENQATDRVFRIGQTQNVQVHKFISTGTLEEKIHDLIESKKELAEQVVGAGEQWLAELDSDNLRNLLILDRNAVIDDDEE